MRVIGTLAVLAVAAFALGAGAGLLWKEPRLVVADWLGDTQEVPWTQGEETAAWPEGEQTEPAERPAEVAAAVVPPVPETPAAAPAVAKPAPVPAAKVAAAKVATPAVSAPPPHGGVAVQVGAFGERSAADALVARLKGSGYSAYVVPSSTAPWRVRVGPYRDRPAAESAATKLAKLSLPTWIQEEPGGR